MCESFPVARIRPSGALLAAAVWLFAVAVAVAWWVGVLDSSGDAIIDPDYMWQPIAMSTLSRAAIGISATLVVAAGAAVLWRTRESAAVPFAAIAAYAGLTYAVGAEPVIGANIGGGMMLLGAVPFTVGMAMWGVRALRSR